ncbi:MAG: ABC transporter ATP-binding protein [Chloroflexi bacterium]|nr:ABC transporter ATP-binding protein [Chloroflexota bacterium]
MTQRIVVPQSIRALWLISGLAFRAEPRGATAALLVTLAESVNGAFFALGMRWLVDGAAHRDAAGVVLSLVLLGSNSLVANLAALLGFALRNGVRERTSLAIERQLASLTAGIPSLDHFERPEYLKQLDLLREERARLGWVHQSAVVVLGYVVTLAGTLLLLASVDWVLLALPLFGLPIIYLSGRAQRRMHAVQEELIEPRRLEWHLYDVATSAAAGKEVRVFGLRDEIMRRHRQLRRLLDHGHDVAQLRMAAETMLGWIIFALGFVGAILFVALRASRGEATLGDVAMTIALANQVQSQLAGLVGETTQLLWVLDASRRYVWLVEYAAAVERPTSGALVAPPDALRRGIRLDGVTFRYPGTEREVLRDVSLQIPAGATVAIVGENGAGKTTLVKLLTRLYEPTDGRILADGVDLRQFAIAEWRARTSAGFQDFARFELLARENVGVGDLTRLADPIAVGAALDRAEASGVIATLPSGLETQLGASFEDGAELSGGQWQKLALGRAMMRTTPLLLVLDEPTAALDAQAEHALFERYAGAAREQAANGAITVLVSHRFSTVRMADLIVVVADGRIAEVGGHDDLMTAAGLYSELYELQARAYR